MIICPVVFIFFGIFWQSISTPRKVFVDKYCINQTDPELKKAGIKGIAGFLRHSDRLVVFWTPSYFTRLWCSYELASWVHLGKSDVRFVPVSFAVASGMSIVGLYVNFVVASVYEAIFGKVPFVLTLCSLPMLCLLVTLSSRRHLRELASLHGQLSDFSVRKTRCFCCDVGHVNPLTGQPIPCDRALVYDALRGWHAAYSLVSTLSDGEELPHLHFFDCQVREKIRPHLLSAGGYRIAYRDAVVMSSPCAWYYVTRAAYLENLPPLEWMRWAAFAGTVVLAAVPLAFQFGFLFRSYLERISLERSPASKLQRFCLPFSVLSMLCIFFFFWGSAALPFYHFRSPFPMIFLSSVLVALALTVFGGLRSLGPVAGLLARLEGKF